MPNEVNKERSAIRAADRELDAYNKKLKEAAIASGKVTPEGLAKAKDFADARAKFENGGARSKLPGNGNTVGTSVNQSSGGILNTGSKAASFVAGNISNPILQSALGKPTDDNAIASALQGAVQFSAFNSIFRSNTESTVLKIGQLQKRFTEKYPGRIFTNSVQTGDIFSKKIINNQTVSSGNSPFELSGSIPKDRTLFEGVFRKDFYVQNAAGGGGFQGLTGNLSGTQKLAGIAALLGSINEIRELGHENTRLFAERNRDLSDKSKFTYEEQIAYNDALAGAALNPMANPKWVKERIQLSHGNIGAIQELGRSTLERANLFREALLHTNDARLFGPGTWVGNGNTQKYLERYDALRSKYARQLGVSDNSAQVLELAQKGVMVDMWDSELKNIKDFTEAEGAAGTKNSTFKRPERNSAKEIILDKVEAMREKYFEDIGLSYIPRYLTPYHVLDKGGTNTVAQAENNR